MFEKSKAWPAAALAGGLVALAALIGCGGEPSVASQSAAAFREAQAKGETFEGAAHGHGAMTPGGGQEMPSAVPEGGSAAGHSGMAMEGMDHSGMAMEGANPSGKAQGGMDHSGMAMGGENPSGKAQEGMDHSGMVMEGANPSTAPTAVAASPGQPAKTLSPDALDAPAPTSVLDAQRSAERAEGMAGMEGMEGMEHGGHGGGTYRQIDAGRGPGASEGSEPQAPGAAETHQHDPSSAAADAVYACPMHPEVTSNAPGKCSKCGMDLVERRKE